MSSDLGQAPPAASPTVAAYAFEQLEPPPGGVTNPADLLASAWVQAEEIRARARAEGEAQGRAEGLAAARDEVAAAIDALRQALADVAAMRAELIEALEHDAAELAFRLSEQVIAGVIDVEPERVIDVARNALRRVTDRRRVILVANPADLEVVRGAVKGLQAELGGIEHCDVQSDRRVACGGAILRTEAGEIDVTIDSQLERAREIVAATLKGEDDGG
jgi:flagellar assembly protein FliH